MGWSCTQEQDEALNKLVEATHPTVESSKFFIESPSGGPYGKDYGTSGCKTMCCAVYKLLSNGTCTRVGYARISPDGKTIIPRELRAEIG